MTITVTASGPSPFPRVLVEVSTSPSVTAPLTLWRIHADGSRNPVLTSGKVVGGWKGYDPHPPFNQTIQYVAEVDGQESAASGSVIVLSQAFWVMHPVYPSRNLRPIKVVGPQEPTSFASRAEEFQPLGSDRPVVRTSYERMREAGRVKLQITREQVTLAKALFGDDSPVLFNGPWGQHDLGWMWVQPKDVSISNPGGFIDFPTRTVDFSYIECRAPNVAPAPPLTVGEATAAFPTATVADMESVWATLGDARIDRRI